MASLGADAAYAGSESRSVDDVVGDNTIKLDLNAALIDSDLGLFKDVSTVVYKRAVYRLGTVEDAGDRAAAERVARAVEGVGPVVNLLRVTLEGDIGAYVDEVVLEKRIQSELLFDRDIRSANYRVRSVLNTIYVIGSAENSAELDRVIRTVRSYDDVRDVVTYVSVP